MCVKFFPHTPPNLNSNCRFPPKAAVSQHAVPPIAWVRVSSSCQDAHRLDVTESPCDYMYCGTRGHRTGGDVALCVSK